VTVPRHHVVPQMLLRRFADPRERLVMVDRDPPHRAVTTTVRTAAAENGFYRISTDEIEEGHRDGHDPEAVEKALAGVEGVVRPLLADLARGRFPGLEDRFRISFFMGLQATRGQGFRDEMERMATLAARSHLAGTVTADRIRGWLREDGRPNGPAEVREFAREMLRDDGWSLRMSHGQSVQESLRFGVDVIAPRIYFCAWEVWQFRADVLLTSDAPVAVWSPPRRDGLPVGIADAREVYLPLDRRTALVVTRKPQDTVADRTVAARTSRAVRINTAVAQNAHRWIYHHPEGSPLTRIQIGPRMRWVEEPVSAAVDADGTMRLRGMYVKRAVAVGDAASPRGAGLGA
jgi:hypothetical protein